MKTQKGYIYILIHPTQPGYLKIGHTLRTPEERAKEITRQSKTGLAGAYVVAYEEEVQDSFTIEQIVHKKLEKHQTTQDREFFYYPLKAAIKIVRSTIINFKNQKTIEFDVDNPIIWWSNLDISWKLIFRAHIPNSKTPKEEELMEGLFTIINYCREPKIRKIVAQFLEKKNHQNFILKWFNELSSPVQKTIKNHVPHLLDLEEIDKIFKLEKLDCSGNLLIQDLTPLIHLEDLSFLDCSNTSVDSLEPLKKLLNLKSLRINHLSLSSVKPLYDLDGLSEITSHGTIIKDNSLAELKVRLSHCNIQEDAFGV